MVMETLRKDAYVHFIFYILSVLRNLYKQLKVNLKTIKCLFLIENYQKVNFKYISDLSPICNNSFCFCGVNPFWACSVFFYSFINKVATKYFLWQQNSRACRIKSKSYLKGNLLTEIFATKVHRMKN